MGRARGPIRRLGHRVERSVRKGVGRGPLWRLAERRVAGSDPYDVGERPPLIILFTGRSGSHFVAGLLNSIPGVANRGEMLHPKQLRPRWLMRLVGDYSMRFSRPEYATRYIARTLSVLDTPQRVVRFQPAQLKRANIDTEDLDDAFPGARYLVLYRRRLGHQFLSGQVARLSGRWSWYRGRPFEPFAGTLRIDPEQFRRWSRNLRENYRWFLSQPPVIERGVTLCYEDVAENPQAAFERTVFPLLGITPSPVSSGWLKMNRRSPREVIENYDEVASLLFGPAAVQDYELPSPAGPPPRLDADSASRTAFTRASGS